MVQVHCKLKHEVLKKFKWMKKLHGVLYDTKWIMFHGLLDIVLVLSKEVDLILKKIGALAIVIGSLAPQNKILP